MAFVFSTDDHSPDWYRSVGTTALVGLVGHDSELGFIYLYEVGIHPAPGVGTPELYFYLIQRHPASNQTHQIWSGAQTSTFIGKAERVKILEQILIGARCVIQDANPPSVVRYTWDENPPPKALRKHEEINKVFIGLGYVITPLEIKFGTYGWRADRV